MEIYNYHPVTGEYLNASQADESPLEPGTYLIPAHACPDAPPAIGPNEAAIRSNGAWSLVPDYRGTVYYLPDGSKRDITELGIAPPADALSDPPPPSDAERWIDYQTAARAALVKTDVTMARIAEAVALGDTTWGAIDVVAFLQHRRDLRAILSQPQPEIIPTELPAHPGYPAGT